MGRVGEIFERSLTIKQGFKPLKVRVYGACIEVRVRKFPLVEKANLL